LTKAKEVAAIAATGAANAANAAVTAALDVANAATAGAPAVAGTQAAPATPATASSTAPAEPPPPPPAELTGTWKAAPAPDTAITLELQPDGAFTWSVTNKGREPESITGRAVYVDNVLSLTQEEGPPLAGKIESKDASKFVFHFMGGGNNAPALTFTR
jgi:hypothetical protein